MRRPTRLGHLAAIALAATFASVASGCAGTSTATPTVAPSTPAPTAAATAAGPAAFAAWTERQGFGGSSGLNILRKDAAWLIENRYDVELYLLDDHGHDAANLIAWLDAHEPTACWVAFHASMRTALQTIAGEWAQASVERAGAGAVSAETAKALSDELERAYAMAPLAGCP